MIVRTALAGVTAALLLGSVDPAGARDAENARDAGVAMWPDAGPVAGSASAMRSADRPSAGKPARRRLAIGVLPPARPPEPTRSDEGLPDPIPGPSPVERTASAPNAEPVGGAVVADGRGADLPPPRPEQIAEPVPAPSPVQPAAVKVGAVVLPPLRPAFAHPQASAPSKAEAAIGEVEAPRAARPGGFAVVRLLPPARPGFASDEADLAAVPPSAPEPAPATSPLPSLFGATPSPSPSLTPAVTSRIGIEERIAFHAKLNDVPEDLVHRVVVRESKYNPRAVGRGGAMGLMQIKTATARGLGYEGQPVGLLDAETNLTYAVKYLAGAYRVAGGDRDQAVRNYARGYYYQAKQQGFARATATGARPDRHRAKPAPNGDEIAAEEPVPARRGTRTAANRSGEDRKTDLR